ncbi:hypothetical protein R1flu_023803 [Riccia fluitans]|uniref:Uncharacterized protein n=1 Tax=Riccia fluitans TaxID=41844 RepID=A0ABD1XT37_9MARC
MLPLKVTGRAGEGAPHAALQVAFLIPAMYNRNSAGSSLSQNALGRTLGEDPRFVTGTRLIEGEPYRWNFTGVRTLADRRSSSPLLVHDLVTGFLDVVWLTLFVFLYYARSLDRRALDCFVIWRFPRSWGQTESSVHFGLVILFPCTRPAWLCLQSQPL